MNNKKETLRLLYPQWQGGIVAHWMPELPAEDASKGYFLGCKLLEMLAPHGSGQMTAEVPISLDYARETANGVCGLQAIRTQTAAALEIIRAHAPSHIVTLGGECSVSVAPFTYLADKYRNDTAIVWIDAHPDISLPNDEYAGYHAMAVTACMGMGEESIVSLLPAKVAAENIVVVGLRAWENEGGTPERQQRLGLKGISPKEVAGDSSSVMEWLAGRGISKVMVHFDLDALDPAEIIAGVGIEPNGLKIDDAVGIICDIAARYDLVGLTIAEPMPRTAIKLRNMLARLPLLNE